MIKKLNNDNKSPRKKLETMTNPIELEKPYMQNSKSWKMEPKSQFLRITI